MQLNKAFIGTQVDKTHNSLPLAYYLPDKFVKGSTYPLVIGFHGTGEFGDGTDASLTNNLINKSNFDNLKKLCDAQGFILVTPQYVQALNDWQPGPPAAWRKSVHTWALNTLPVNSLLGITGYSGGGGDAWRFCTDPDLSPKVTCAVIICGVPVYECDFTQIAKNHIPLKVYHAADDGTVGVAASRNQVAKVKDAGANPAPSYTEFKTGGHGIWGQVYATAGLFAELGKGEEIEPDPVQKIVSSFDYVGYKVTFSDGSVEVATSVVPGAGKLTIKTNSGTYSITF